ncbi:hypothetical protein OMW55_07395 [Sphingomonas sp. BN140010]|uniref:Uncharacterized protein n=1 Tax=Sphingomonas arvum TaxID=2992113 RepID=A0ABT3JF15_9SPHN|nr:hypothetical protein [Sphingomonas sp. BN140010]MCW3797626.1 hypothetical protein [Sphingomonas sp. BN140010]
MEDDVPPVVELFEKVLMLAIPAKPVDIFDDHDIDLTGIDQLDHSLETGPRHRSSADTIVREVGDQVHAFLASVCGDVATLILGRSGVLHLVA